MADPKACRERAIRCAEMANAQADDRHRTALYEMATNWLKVAAELERMHSYIDDDDFGLKPT